MSIMEKVSKCIFILTKIGNSLDNNPFPCNNASNNSYLITYAMVNSRACKEEIHSKKVINKSKFEIHNSGKCFINYICVYIHTSNGHLVKSQYSRSQEKDLCMVKTNSSDIAAH